MGLPIPPAARKDARPASGEEKKKNLSEGFRQSTVTPSPQTQTSRGGQPKIGKSSLGSDCSLAFGGGARAGCGIGSVLNPVERITGARKAPGWRCGCGSRSWRAPAAAGGLSSPRLRFGVWGEGGECGGKLRRETGGPERTALPLVRPSSSWLPAVKSQRNLQRPPGTAENLPRR